MTETASQEWKDKRETRVWNAKARWALDQVKRLMREPAPSGQSRRQRLQLAESLVERVQVMHPACFPRERVYWWEELATAWFRQSNITRVEHCLRRMAELQPGCADAYLNLGYYLTEMGIRDRAVQVYWEGLQVNPADQYIIYNLAELYRSGGRRQRALRIIDEAIASGADPAMLHKSKGDLWLEWGHPGMAALSYELALPQLDREHAAFVQETLHRLAESYQAAGEPDRAIATWERTLQTYTTDRTALFNLTVLYYQRQAWQQTINYGMRLLARGEQNEEVVRLVNLSQDALGLGQIHPLPPRPQAASQEPGRPVERDPLIQAMLSDCFSDEEWIEREREEYIQIMMGRGYNRADAEAYVDAFY